MARRFFAYDPWDYTPYGYHRPASAFFPSDSSEPRPRPKTRPVSIPVHFVDSEPKKTEAAGPKKPAMSPAEAAVRVQAAARRFLTRRMVRAVRAVEREAGEIAGRVEADRGALRADARARATVGEALMRLLFRLDAVHGVREYRRRVARRVLALQDAVDALEEKTVDDSATGASVVTDDVVTEVDENGRRAEGIADAAAEKPEANAMGGSASSEAEEAVSETLTEMVTEEAVAEGAEEAAKTKDRVELDGKKSTDGPAMEAPSEGASVVVTDEAVADEAEETTKAKDGAEHDSQKGKDGPAWEAPEGVSETAMVPEAEEGMDGRAREKGKVVAKGESTEKLMEMVAALCERSAQQCAVIGALAERVEVLERAVSRMEKRKRKQKKQARHGAGAKSMRGCFSD